MRHGRLKRRVTTEMIAPGPGVPQTLADEARRSLDDEVAKLRVDGILEAGKATMERLKWTDVTLKAARDFEKVNFRKTFISYNANNLRRSLILRLPRPLDSRISRHMRREI